MAFPLPNFSCLPESPCTSPSAAANGFRSIYGGLQGGAAPASLQAQGSQIFPADLRVSPGQQDKHSLSQGTARLLPPAIQQPTCPVGAENETGSA